MLLLLLLAASSSAVAVGLLLGLPDLLLVAGMLPALRLSTVPLFWLPLARRTCTPASSDATLWLSVCSHGWKQWELKESLVHRAIWVQLE